MTQPQTAEDRQAEVDKEWGQYVATGPIDIGSARAFNEGDPVPASHVTRGVVRPDQVAPAPVPEQSSGEPAGNASLADWQVFARTRGATDEDMDGQTRDQLRDLYSQKG
jgi:hypothetical protein